MTDETDEVKEFGKPGRQPVHRSHLSLRDQFAMAALTGLIPDRPVIPDTMARTAYAIADAMLKARSLTAEDTE